MNVLITGGSGFIGTALVKKLLTQDDIAVTIIDTLSEKIHGPAARPYDHRDPRVTFVRGDAGDRAVLEPLLLTCDAVVHLAAETGTGQSMYDIEHYARVNVMGTAVLLDILSRMRHSVRKVVIASSRAIYGEGAYLCVAHGTVYPGTRRADDMDKGSFEPACPVCGGPLTLTATGEDAKIHPISLYGITKQVQESMVMTMCPQLGIAPVALRYQNVYGPGQSLSNPYTGILSIFSNRLRQNRPIEIFEDGMESRDFVFIDDVAAATAEALRSPHADGHVFNVGYGSAVTVLDLACELKKIYRSSSELAVNGKYRVGDIRHNVADITLIRERLGFSPATGIKQGLTAFAGWVLTQGISPDRYQESLAELKNRGMYK